MRVEERQSADVIVGPVMDRRILLQHLIGVMFLGAGVAQMTILPFLGRKQFSAGAWQVWVLTVAVPFMQFISIFWHQFYRHTSSVKYLLIVGSFASLSFAAMAFAKSMNVILILAVLAAFGGGGGGAALSPLNADLLRSCYPASVRGRVFGAICAAQFTGIVIFGQLAGVWSDHDPYAYRVFLPLTGILIGVGLFLLSRITASPAFKARTLETDIPDFSVWSALRDMRRILGANRRFASYELAFMSYGVGWMICTALVPFIAEDKLGLKYTEFSHSIIVAYWLTNIAMLIPIGRVLDVVGPARLASGSFLWLALYPLLLLFVASGTWLGVASVCYALGMVGVHLTWTVGPVTLAETPAMAPQYLAIHGTLVGVRGIVAQGFGVLLYWLTGSFTLPLLIASAGFIYAAYRMRRLALEMK